MGWAVLAGTGSMPLGIWSAPDALPVQVAADDPLLRYVGRFDTRDAAGPRCAWSASEVRIRFQGTAFQARIREEGQDFWQTVIDGRPGAVLELLPGEQVYAIASGLAAGEHQVELVKATEGAVGVTQFTGFQLSEGGKLLPVPARPRRLEVIGDSISCGYGNMASSPHEPFSPRTENAYYTYGAIAARKLQADYLCVAFSGKKMWPDNRLPELYDRTLTWDGSSAWSFASFTPEAVVINLATNDFGRENPEEAGWVAAYVAFIQRVRRNYPEARIYCAIGTMMGDWEPRKPLTTLRTYLAKVVAACAAEGESRVGILDFGVQDVQDGIGANWHPSRKTQEIMAAKLVQRLKADLEW